VLNRIECSAHSKQSRVIRAGEYVAAYRRQLFACRSRARHKFARQNVNVFRFAPFKAHTVHAAQLDCTSFCPPTAVIGSTLARALYASHFVTGGRFHDWEWVGELLPWRIASCSFCALLGGGGGRWCAHSAAFARRTLIETPNPLFLIDVRGCKFLWTSSFESVSMEHGVCGQNTPPLLLCSPPPHRQRLRGRKGTNAFYRHVCAHLTHSPALSLDLTQPAICFTFSSRKSAT
jgi:hypothetical protein